MPTEPTQSTAADQLQLALERTYLAYERTLMAWIRTAASLITFGFTLFKYFEYLREQQPGQPAPQLLGMRTYGVVMIWIGVAILVLATWQHHLNVKRLKALYPTAPFSLALALAGLISVLGILAIIATMFQM